MSWPLAVFTFLVTWPLMTMMLLPFGIQLPNLVEKGHAPSAPMMPMVKKKALIALVISLMITALAAWLSNDGMPWITNKIPYYQ